MPKVFVYGTLKQGHCYHYLLQAFEAIPAIAPHIDLHNGPDYPFAIRGLGQVYGEVYFINHSVLQQLDELEDHPDDYCRELTPVILPQGQMIQAWIYLNPKAKLYPPIETGCWVPNLK